MLTHQVYFYDDLPKDTLYDILALRNRVFAVEQQCLFLDVDGYDKKAHHFCLFDQDVLIGYVRFFAPGIKDTASYFGRVAIHPDHRGKKLGHLLVAEVLKSIESLFGKVSIKIQAQAQLENFYQTHGFKTIAEPYIFEGIPHIDMLRVA
jgi:ElaA protein